MEHPTDWIATDNRWAAAYAVCLALAHWDSERDETDESTSSTQAA